MPKIKNYTLEKLCLDFIVKNKGNLPKTSTLIEPTLGTEESKFDRFDPQLRKYKLGRILQYLEGKFHLTKIFLEFFITHELCYLRLIGLFETEMSELLELASMRCPNLLVLKLYGSISDNILSSCLPKFGNLRELTMHNDKIQQERFLEEIGAQCRNLRYLNLSFCPITDSGILNLCYSVVDQVVKKIPRGICKSLEVLDLQGTKVTHTGIKIALTHLLGLKSLAHDNTVEAIADLTIDAKKNGHVVQMFSLTGLSILSSYRGDNSLQTAVGVCQFITTFEVTTVGGFNNRDLQYLRHLAFLVDLTITGYEIGGNVTFESDVLGHGISSLLSLKGRLLKSLEVSSFNDVNIRSVILFCPLLKKLSLKDNIYSSETIDEQSCSKRQKMSYEILGELEELWLVDCDDEDGCFTHDSIANLFLSPLLKKVFIWKSQKLDDDVIVNANILHSFKHLELIEFHDCSLLTDLAVNVLLHSVNPLHTLVLDSCLNFTQVKCEKWISETRLGNLDLCIHYEEQEVSEEAEEDEV